MVVAASVTAANLSVPTNPATSHGQSSMSLGELVDPASAHDISAFQQTVQQAAQQNANIVASGNSTYSANSVGESVLKFVDSIQFQKAKISSYAANLANLSPGETVKFQEALENYTLSTGLLSKVITSATKAVDSIVHMQ